MRNAFFTGPASTVSNLFSRIVVLVTLACVFGPNSTAAVHLEPHHVPLRTEGSKGRQRSIIVPYIFPEEITEKPFLPPLDSILYSPDLGLALRSLSTHRSANDHTMVRQLLHQLRDAWTTHLQRLDELDMGDSGDSSRGSNGERGFQPEQISRAAGRGRGRGRREDLERGVIRGGRDGVGSWIEHCHRLVLVAETVRDHIELPTNVFNIILAGITADTCQVLVSESL